MGACLGKSNAVLPYKSPLVCYLGTFPQPGLVQYELQKSNIDVVLMESSSKHEVDKAIKVAQQCLLDLQRLLSPHDVLTLHTMPFVDAELKKIQYICAAVNRV